MIGYIYSLECINTGAIIYIGCTTRPLEKRFTAHKSAIKSSNGGVYEYIRANSLDVKIDIIERIKYKNKIKLLEAEEFWIEQFRQWGFPLKNKYNSNPKEIKIRNPLGNGSIAIDPEVLNEAREFCKRTGRFLQGFINNALREKLEKSK